MYDGILPLLRNDNRRVETSITRMLYNSKEMFSQRSKKLNKEELEILKQLTPKLEEPRIVEFVLTIANKKTPM